MFVTVGLVLLVVRETALGLRALEVVGAVRVVLLDGLVARWVLVGGTRRMRCVPDAEGVPTRRTRVPGSGRLLAVVSLASLFRLTNRRVASELSRARWMFLVVVVCAGRFRRTRLVSARRLSRSPAEPGLRAVRIVVLSRRAVRVRFCSRSARWSACKVLPPSLPGPRMTRWGEMSLRGKVDR